jgi:hypothetical protein
VQQWLDRLCKSVFNDETVVRTEATGPELVGASRSAAIFARGRAAGDEEPRADRLADDAHGRTARRQN